MPQRVAIVTGAGSGIGLATCEAFARQGVAVVAAGRTAVRLSETVARVQALGGQCVAVPTHIGEATEVDRLVEAAVDRFDRVDVLVNNAGAGPRAKAAEMSREVFDEMLAVNAAGVFYACQAVWPVMLEQGGGTIINISSMAAQDPFPGLVPYGATKAFVNLLTKGLAEEGRKHNIVVIGVGPGAVETRMLRASFPDLPADQVLQPDAIADVIVSLTGSEFRHCTGQTIYVRK